LNILKKYKMKKKILLLMAVATLGLTAATMAQVPSYVPTNGLVGYWPFNGNANDESGNGNNGTVNGATLTSDRNGIANSAYSFDGVNDFIQTNSLGIGGNSSRTFSLWYFTNNYGPLQSLLSYGLDNIPNNYINLWTSSTCTGIGLDISYAYKDYSNSVLTGQWNHYILIIDSSSGINLNSAQIYQNGIPLTTLCNNANLNNSINTILQYSITFGKYHAQSTCFLNGKLDDIGIWNRALTQQEIAALYNGCQLSVNTQPNSQTSYINNNAQFIVGTSDPNATYQWQTDLGIGFQNVSNAGQYNGTSNDTLSVANVSMSNNNQQFRCIINSGSCVDTSNVAVLTINNNVGIHEMAQHNLFSVFPNPAHNVINVKADHKLIGSVFTIYDNTGKAVQSGKINAANTSIELSNLSSGIYMFSVGENIKQTFKIIKE
jgi:hypothetical protein